MKKERITQLIALLVSYILTTQLTLANPYLFSGKNLSGSSVRLLETSPYDGGRSPDTADYIHFSPPLSYYVISLSPGVNDLYGDNGIIRNKSIYVPQCWRTYLRVIPKDQFDLNVGEGYFNVVNLFPFISYGFYPGVYEFATHSAEDQYIGYAAVKDPSCVPTHDPLIMSRPRYEFFRCNGYSAEGYISWTKLQGNINYAAQRKSGSRWYTVYSGGKNGFRYTGASGGHKLRVRASAEGINGPWYNFSARLPLCPGTQPY